MFGEVFRPSGGLFYHAKARCFCGKLWQPYIQAVNSFLEAYTTRKNTLCIVGPSGGYTLPDSFLNRFQNIQMIEPDPLAKFFFSFQHKNLRAPTQWLKTFPKEGFDTENTLFFFSNSLTQIALENPVSYEQYKRFVQNQHVEWLSLSDYAVIDLEELLPAPQVKAFQSYENLNQFLVTQWQKNREFHVNRLQPENAFKASLLHLTLWHFTPKVGHIIRAHGSAFS